MYFKPVFWWNFYLSCFLSFWGHGTFISLSLCFYQSVRGFLIHLYTIYVYVGIFLLFFLHFIFNVTHSDWTKKINGQASFQTPWNVNKVKANKQTKLPLPAWQRVSSSGMISLKQPVLTWNGTLHMPKVARGLWVTWLHSKKLHLETYVTNTCDLNGNFHHFLFMFWYAFKTCQ